MFAGKRAVLGSFMSLNATFAVKSISGAGVAVSGAKDRSFEGWIIIMEQLKDLKVEKTCTSLGTSLCHVLS